MELELTKRNLRRIAELDNPAIEDVLGFIYDFCQDIKTDTGTPVEKLACREEDAMYKRLPWLGRTVTKISKENAPLLTSESRRDRISEIEAKLAGLDQEMEEAGRLQAELQNRIILIKQRREEVAAQKHAELEMQEQIRHLQEQVQGLEALDLEELRRRRDMLQDQIRNQEEKRQEQEQQIEGLRTELDAAEQTLQDILQRSESLRQQVRDLENQRQMQQAEQDALRYELQETEEQTAALEQEIASLKRQKEKQETSTESLMRERNQLQMELESEEAKMRFRMLESRQKEITLLKDRLQRIRFLREQLLQDWNSPWGEETRALVGSGSAAEVPAEILHADLDEMRKKLTQYGEDLRELAVQMNSLEFRN
ncbi:MAG: hypothetical protein IJI10_09540 [Eubacterium sp.]|nr:hypothetical protein [Eubacterium sp.]